MRRALKIFLMSLWLLPHLATADTVLLMAEEDGCYWCANWTKEIGPIYPKTPEGQMAPFSDMMSPVPRRTGCTLIARFISPRPSS